MKGFEPLTLVSLENSKVNRSILHPIGATLRSYTETHVRSMLTIPFPRFHRGRSLVRLAQYHFINELFLLSPFPDSNRDFPSQDETDTLQMRFPTLLSGFRCFCKIYPSESESRPKYSCHSTLTPLLAQLFLLSSRENYKLFSRTCICCFFNNNAK